MSEEEIMKLLKKIKKNTDITKFIMIIWNISFILALIIIYMYNTSALWNYRLVGYLLTSVKARFIRCVLVTKSESVYVMYKKLTIGIFFIIVIVGLSGCNEINPSNSYKSKIVGTWMGEDDNGAIANFTFTIDNSGNLTTGGGILDFMYDIKDNRITLKVIPPEDSSDEYPFDIILEYLFISDNILSFEFIEPKGSVVLFDRVD